MALHFQPLLPHCPPGTSSIGQCWHLAAAWSERPRTWTETGSKLFGLHFIPSQHRPRFLRLCCPPQGRRPTSHERSAPAGCSALTLLASARCRRRLGACKQIVRCRRGLSMPMIGRYPVRSSARRQTDVGSPPLSTDFSAMAACSKPQVYA
jgi:hypothetical protein